MTDDVSTSNTKSPAVESQAIDVGEMNAPEDGIELGTVPGVVNKSTAEHEAAEDPAIPGSTYLEGWRLYLLTLGSVLNPFPDW